MADGKVKGLRVMSDRELLRRMYSHRAVPPCTPEAREEEAALELEWWRRAWAIRGPFKRGRLARHREQRLALFMREKQAYFEGAADRDQVWGEAMLRQQAMIEELARRSDERALKLARLVDELEASVQAAEDPAAPLSAAERARLAWGGKAGKGEPS